MSTYYQGNEVAWVDVPSCSVPLVQVAGAQGSATGSATVDATFLTSSAGSPIDPKTATLTSATGESLTVSPPVVDAKAGTLSFALQGLAPGKHSLTVEAKDTQGRVADAARATVWIEPRPFDWRDAVIYEIMVDRYRGPGRRAARRAGDALSARAGATSTACARRSRRGRSPRSA